MEHLLHFHNSFKCMIFQRCQKALFWSNGLIFLGKLSSGGSEAFFYFNSLYMLAVREAVHLLWDNSGIQTSVCYSVVKNNFATKFCCTLKK